MGRGSDLMRIELVVDELALIGFDARDGAGIGDAVQAELARLLGTPDAPFVARLTHRASGTHVATVDAGNITLGARGRAASNGRHIARAVHRALSVTPQTEKRS